MIGTALMLPHSNKMHFTYTELVQQPLVSKIGILKAIEAENFKFFWQLNQHIFVLFCSKAGGGRDMFASVGADGSVRMFDLRHLEHSTIIYEDQHHTPLLRLAWNKQDPNYLATVAMDACEVIILDVRVPCTPVARLNNHRACVNGIAWAPHSSCHVCTAGDDHQALIWDIQQMPRAIEDPILAYTAAEGEINQIQWGATQPDWIAICYNKNLEILRVWNKKTFLFLNFLLDFFINKFRMLF